MNKIKSIYCRIFQTCFKIAIPVLPYRKPETISSIDNLPAVLKKNNAQESYWLRIQELLESDFICL